MKPNQAQLHSSLQKFVLPFFWTLHVDGGKWFMETL